MAAKRATEVQAAPTRDPLADQYDQITQGKHGQPHAVLGIHEAPNGDGLIVRAHHPEAEAMFVRLSGEERIEMHRVHPLGIFAAPVPERALAEGYMLEGRNGDIGWVYEDAYRFWPTLGDLDVHLFNEGRHRRLWDVLGAHHRTHQGVPGTAFAVWAPSAQAVRVVGDFNAWDGRLHPMRSLGSSGVWELFVPGAKPGDRYKYEVVTRYGEVKLKTDPFAFQMEVPPAQASVIASSEHTWQDANWCTQRDARERLEQPMSIYEMHLGSWRWTPDDSVEGGWRPLNYRELAVQLPEYLSDLGFTHVEFLPVSEHPFTPSWGYQVSGYYAPTSRFGTPDDFRALVDALHARGIGVIVDWVPAHFPKDDFALARFDGTALFEHADPRQGEHPDWGTLVFNFGRHEVRNFLIANALYWIEEFHIDGLRVDAVASMLYLDYSRKEGEWVPNEHGGRENLEAVSFLKEFNETVYAEHPGVMTIAEESTAWPAVSRPTYLGGLGFGFKWNMGWMHDTLEYFSKDPIHRRYHHNDLTFGLLYAFSENFVLPLSHDEVVHGKGSLIGKMPGDRWQELANLRALYSWMWAHPGKQLLFMGGELAQSSEWGESRSLDWHLLDFDEHRGIQHLIRTLNHTYVNEPALFTDDFTHEGFEWIDASDVDNNILSFLRKSKDGSRTLVCVANLAPVPRHDYRIGLPQGGAWREVFNSDWSEFGGSGVSNGEVQSHEESWHGRPHSATVTLPPLGVVWLTPA